MGGHRRATESVRGVRLPRPRTQAPEHVQKVATMRYALVYSPRPIQACYWPVKTYVSSYEMMQNSVPVDQLDQQLCPDFKEEQPSRVAGGIRKVGVLESAILSRTHRKNA